MKIEVMQQVLDAEFNRGYKEGVRDAYASSPQRPWVGLTEEETSGFTPHEMAVVKYVSKVLQEKNNAS